MRSSSVIGSGSMRSTDDVQSGACVGAVEVKEEPNGDGADESSAIHSMRLDGVMQLVQEERLERVTEVLDLVPFEDFEMLVEPLGHCPATGAFFAAHLGVKGMWQRAVEFGSDKAFQRLRRRVATLVAEDLTAAEKKTERRLTTAGLRSVLEAFGLRVSAGLSSQVELPGTRAGKQKPTPQRAKSISPCSSMHPGDAAPSTEQVSSKASSSSSSEQASERSSSAEPATQASASTHRPSSSSASSRTRRGSQRRRSRSRRARDRSLRRRSGARQRRQRGRKGSAGRRRHSRERRRSRERRHSRRRSRRR